MLNGFGRIYILMEKSITFANGGSSVGRVVIVLTEPPEFFTYFPKKSRTLRRKPKNKGTMSRKLNKGQFETLLNDVYGKGEHEICGKVYHGFYGTLLRRHDPIAFNEAWWDSGNGH